jgi:hypothetical protein
MARPGDWIQTRRTSPQFWILQGISILFVVGADFYWINSGDGSIGPAPVWVILVTGLTAFVAAIGIYVTDIRIPRAVRLTPTCIEIRTRFGRVLRLPRETARLAASWPSSFGNLRSPAVRGWVGLDPDQFSLIRQAAGPDDQSERLRGITLEADPVEHLKAIIASTKRIPVSEMRSSPGFMPTPIARPLGTAVAFFAPFFLLLTALLLWLNTSRPGYFGPNWVVWFLFVGMVLLWTPLIWSVGVGMTSFGIALSEEGVLHFGRPLRGPFALQRTLSWASLREPKLESSTWPFDLTTCVISSWDSFSAA